MKIESIEENTVKATKQVNENSNIFYLGNSESRRRMVILGNSITRHGVLPEIGWFNDYGMAASSKQNDYVHVLESRMKRDFGDFYIMVNQISEWESAFDTYDINKLKAIRDFEGDVIVFRCGENILSATDKKQLTERLNCLLDYVNPKRSLEILTTSFWKNPLSDECVEELSARRGGVLVKLGDLGDNDAMKARGLFEHSGVAAHPGDLGMKTIADRIYNAVKENINF